MVSRLFAPLVFVAALAVTASLPGGAFAHARYEHSDPADGAAVASAPAAIKVWFTQGVKSGPGSALKVVNASGQQVDNGDAKVDASVAERNVMTVSLRPNLPAGAYTVQWKTVSDDDGEEADGTFSFSVRGATTPTAPAAASAPPVAPAAAAAGAPAAQPAPAQAPRGLPNTGTGGPGAVPLVLALGGLLLGLGARVRRARR